MVIQIFTFIQCSYCIGMTYAKYITYSGIEKIWKTNYECYIFTMFESSNKDIK